jgi:hypothetical protein
MTAFRRHCYDKPHRCPGWAGGGWKYPKPHRDICDGGSLTRQMHGPERRVRLYSFRSYRCGKCGTRTIPFVTRWLDPTWYRFWRPWDSMLAYRLKRLVRRITP